MDMKKNSELGQIITRLIARENLTQEEAYEAFRMVLANDVSEMQQGAFLAALTGKGETGPEVAGGWRAVYELDTNKVDLSGIPIVVINRPDLLNTFHPLMADIIQSADKRRNIGRARFCC